MSNKPLFVKIDEYEELKDMIQLVKNKINESKNALTAIKQLEEQEAAELESWDNEIEKVEKNIEYMQSILFE